MESSLSVQPLAFLPSSWDLVAPWVNVAPRRLENRDGGCGPKILLRVAAQPW